MMSIMEATAKACAAFASEAERVAFLDGYGHGIRQTNATWKEALAAGTRSDETRETAAQSEGCQSGPERQRPNTVPPLSDKEKD